MSGRGKRLVIYTDGAARGNPGPAGIGVVISDGRGNPLKEFGAVIGETTNNVAEYTALIRALEEAAGMDAAGIVVYLDSELVVKQLNGEYKVKNLDLKGLHAAATEFLGRYADYRLIHIPREKNKRADQLANEAIDEAAAKLEAGETEGAEAAPGQGKLF